MIKLYQKPSVRLEFSSILITKSAQQYYTFVLNILCDLIFDVISCFVGSCEISKINVGL